MAAAIRLARVDDVPVLDRVLADAFFDDPVSDWLLPNTGRRNRALQRSMGHVMRKTYLPYGGVWTTEEVDAVALWGKPADPKPAALQQLRGLPTFVATYRRQLPAAIRASRAFEKRRPSQPHWFLDLLAVRPHRQGQGVGSALVAAALAETDRLGVPAFLETSNARTVPLYERLGFVVSEQFDVGPVHVWTMLRQPTSG